MCLCSANTRPIHPMAVDVVDAFDVIYSANEARRIRSPIVMSSLITFFMRAFYYSLFNV